MQEEMSIYEKMIDAMDRCEGTETSWLDTLEPNDRVHAIQVYMSTMQTSYIWPSTFDMDCIIWIFSMIKFAFMILFLPYTTLFVRIRRRLRK